MKSLKKKKIELLKQQQKALRNKLVPEMVVSTRDISKDGLSTLSSYTYKKRKSIRDLKIEQLQRQQKNLKKKLPKRTPMSYLK